MSDQNTGTATAVSHVQDAPSVRDQIAAIRQNARADVRDVVARRERNRTERLVIDRDLAESLRTAVDAGVDRKELAQDAGLSVSAISALVRESKPKKTKAPEKK